MAVVLAGCSSVSDSEGAQTSAVTVAEQSSTTVGGGRDDSAATSSTNPEDVTAPEDTPTTQGQHELVEVGTILADYLGTTPGAVEVFAVIDGVTYHDVAGVANADGDLLELGQTFRAGSLSKSLVSTMVMQMVEEGSVELDAPLSTYLPDFAVGGEASIAQLLSHQSGLANYTAQPAFFPAALADPTKSLSPEDVLEYVDGVEGTEVGTFAYSNTNYILLGLLIEHIDGTDINTSLSNRVTGPAGMTNTFFVTEATPSPSNMVGAWSPGFLDGDPATDITAILTGAWTAGSLVSTAEELAVFLQAFSAGDLVSGSTVTAMTDFGNSPYGFGFAFVELNVGQTGYGHGGAIPGYSSYMFLDPQSGDLIVALSSNDDLNSESLAVAVFGAS